MKKTICLVASLILLFMTACSQKTTVQTPETEVQTPEEAAAVLPPPAEKQLKIGILTGSGAAGADGIHAAQKMKEKYGVAIEIEAYPENYNGDPGIIADSAGKLAKNGADAIVFALAAEGTAEAVNKLREMYPDVLVICCSSADDPADIAAAADVVLNGDVVGSAAAIVEQAKKMGAKTFVHYTFLRDMGDSILADRRDLFSSTCGSLGIQFVDATSPDPEGAEGMAEASEFIREDVPRMIERYGKDTAFFATDCRLQVDLIKMIMQEGALYPAQCHLSPFHIYPEAFGFEVPRDKEGDAAYVIDRTQTAVTTRGGHGRYSTVPLTEGALFVETGVEYAIGYLEGIITERNNADALSAIMDDIAGGEGMTSFTNQIAQNNRTLENYYKIIMGFVNF